MTDVHTLSGAYAVDAVDDIERAQFDRHLADCPDCRAEVAGLREAAALLAATTATAPPAGLRERVLAEAASVRPLPPAEPSPKPVRKPRLPRLLIAAAAAALIGGIGVAVTRPWVDDRPVAVRVMEAEDVQVRTTEVSGGGTATVYRSKSQGLAVLRTRGVPTAPAGKTYQMWLQNDRGAMEPAGLMRGGDATVVLTGDAGTATGVGITVEPAQGSKQPTSKPVALVAL